MSIVSRKHIGRASWGLAAAAQLLLPAAGAEKANAIPTLSGHWGRTNFNLEQPPDGPVFIANTLKCRPPRNRNPAPEELQRCEAFLQRQIALVQPKLILAMGKFAIQQLTGSAEAVGRLRGQVHRYQGVPVVVTYHPAYLLRQLPEKAKAWDDLRLALKVHARVRRLEAEAAAGQAPGA